ncbi:glycosyltransferase family 61 protein [Horticoccus luteus]|uniref:Glycosyltransferase family 61 protein n=1 Tax=Horticoccus luteus TaxID=2862869 RepID=A0A8F9TZG1_9BACT|nr:glycosyltransferase family 61 protein [Horticoccus luteus]QYM80342.1 glycosyltransferase family 61 protein [Horticoccus luteus]
MPLSLRQLAKSAWFYSRHVQVRLLALPRALPPLRRALHLPVNRIFDPLTASPDSWPGRLIRLDPPTTFVRPLPALPYDSTAARFFSARTAAHCNASYVMEFSDAALWGHDTGAIFTSAGEFVAAASHDPCGPRLHAVWTRPFLPRPTHWAGRTLYLVTPEATDNYHHWLIDLLPRIGLIRRAGFDPAAFDRVVVNHRDREYQRETLLALGIRSDAIVAVTPGTHVRCDTLVVPSLKHHNQCIPSADAAFLRQTFLGAARPRAHKRRLFLSRADARIRRLLNERQLHPLLLAHGFEIVSLAGLSVAAQARLFAEAEIVAGPAGAAFANLVFCAPPTQVLEIAPAGWLATYHWMISARRGLAHTIILGEGQVRPGLPDISARSRDLFVDPEKFAAALAQVIAAAEHPAPSEQLA